MVKEKSKCLFSFLLKTSLYWGSPVLTVEEHDCTPIQTDILKDNFYFLICLKSFVVILNLHNFEERSKLVTS